MCQFNFILTQKSTPKSAIEQILNASGFGYTEIENNHVNNQIEGFEKLVLTTEGSCDCGSILGMNQFPSGQQIDIKKEKKKLRKKKWSETKIDRYLEDKLKSQTQNEERRKLELKQEEEGWSKVIQMSINQNIEYYLFHHQFSGALCDEPFTLIKRKYVKISDFEIDQLRNLKDCELIRITR